MSEATARGLHGHVQVEPLAPLPAGIALLKTLPETPERLHQTLTLHIVLGVVLQMAKEQAAPEVEHAFTQARALCQAEVCRLRDVLLLRQTETPQAEAEAWLQRALDVARHQEAKSLELRAAMSLGRLWQQQGKYAAARQLLTGIYGWFTEGFDTVDLQEARACLQAMPR